MSDVNEEQTPQFEDFEPAEEDSPSATPAGGNRNFLIAIGVIGGVFVLALIAMGIYAATVLPKNAAQRSTAAAQVYVMNTVTAQAATAQSLAMAQALTPSSTPPATATPVPPTNTPVLVQPSDTPAPTEEITGANKAETPDPTALAQAAATGDPQVGGGAGGATLSPAQARTATLAVLLTQAAGQPQVGGGFGPTPTALPATGFADEVGLPGLFGLALGLLVLVFVARGLRASTR